MKKLISVLLCFVFVLSFAACSGKPTYDPENEDTRIPAGKTFYVSPDGSDDNDGSKEKPLATLDGAKETVRKYKTENGLPDEVLRLFSAQALIR